MGIRSHLLPLELQQEHFFPPLLHMGWTQHSQCSSIGRLQLLSMRSMIKSRSVATASCEEEEESGIGFLMEASTLASGKQGMGLIQLG